MSLLQISDFHCFFKTPYGIAKAVDGVSIQINESEVLGVVGESGCGKSVLALSILQLLPIPPAFFAGGSILFKDKNLLDLSKNELVKIRGNQISMIFQEPMSALNPVYTIGNQISEVFRNHWKCNQREALNKSIEILDKVGVPAPKSRVKEYPYQLSGGMRQRVMIAMALACRPNLLIADEPTTALDVTIQAQILDLMKQLQKDLKTAIIMISHDLGIIAETAHRIAVMYTGKVVEVASTLDLFDMPMHPYTKGLMQAIPGPDRSFEEGELYEINGTVPSLQLLPTGCSFHPRCILAEPICREKIPTLKEVSPNHWVACWMVDHA
ncbi:MAG: ABC transporter ATP-binding protein [Desulfovermiculus sp.]|nr:ABC transporter ATP-binding protein [Desulfovermiculus sp.]